MKEKVYLGHIDTLLLVEKLLRLKSIQSVRGLLGDEGATNWGQLCSNLYLGRRRSGQRSVIRCCRSLGPPPRPCLPLGAPCRATSSRDL